MLASPFLGTIRQMAIACAAMVFIGMSAPAIADERLGDDRRILVSPGRYGMTQSLVGGDAACERLATVLYRGEGIFDCLDAAANLLFTLECTPLSHHWITTPNYRCARKRTP